MSETEAIFKAARARARERGLPYEGALLPAEAHVILQKQPGARLVDVRSRAELEFVGRVPGSVEIEWKSYPGMLPNPKFIDQLKQQVPVDAVVMFLCRSTIRRRRQPRRATAARTMYSKDSRVIATPAAIAIRSAGGARAACRGRKAERRMLRRRLAVTPASSPVRSNRFPAPPGQTRCGTTQTA